MKRSLVIGAFLLVLFIAGCYASPLAPGPAGPQGQSGATGDPGQSGQQGATGHDGDRGRAGDQGRERRTGDQADKVRPHHVQHESIALRTPALEQ